MFLLLFLRLVGLLVPLRGQPWSHVAHHPVALLPVSRPLGQRDHLFAEHLWRPLLPADGAISEVPVIVDFQASVEEFREVIHG